MRLVSIRYCMLDEDFLPYSAIILFQGGFPWWIKCTGPVSIRLVSPFRSSKAGFFTPVSSRMKSIAEQYRTGPKPEDGGGVEQEFSPRGGGFLIWCSLPRLSPWFQRLSNRDHSSGLIRVAVYWKQLKGTAAGETKAAFIALPCGSNRPRSRIPQPGQDNRAERHSR